MNIDDHAWEFWTRFCNLYGWDTVISAQFAREKPHEVSHRLAIFQAWVYPQLAGRGGRADAKPSTVFNNYVLAVVRTLGRDHVPMPSTRHLEKSLNGLLRSFKQAYDGMSNTAHSNAM